MLDSVDREFSKLDIEGSANAPFLPWQDLERRKRMQPPVKLVLAVIIAVVMSACSSPGAPTPEVGQADSFVTHDDLLAQVAKEVPGFDGMFFDDEGVLNVYLAGDRLSPQAAPLAELETALRSAFGEEILRTPSLRGDALSSQSAPANLKVLAGQFDILTLLEVRRQADSLLSLPGVVSTDLDEARNRVVIGVIDDAAAREVEAELDRLRVARSTVIIEKDEPVQPLVDLRDRIRPARGGIQIEPNEGSFCTLGFNAIRNGIRGFVTNSHCTNIQGGVEGTIFYQDLDATDYGYDASGYKIGVEIADPTYYRYYGSDACPWPARCRYSDSAFVNI